MILFVTVLIAMHFLLLWKLNEGVRNVIKSTQGNTFPAIYKPKDFTIIIPIRNEKHNLNLLIQSLRNQRLEDYSSKIIFVNDHSNDGSLSNLQSLIEDNFPFETSILSLLEHEGSGKKNALLKANNEATSEFIIQIDADTILTENWLNSIMHNVQLDTDLLVLPVSIEGSAQWFEKLEFSALQFVTFGMAGNGFPILCNGANLVYRNCHWITSFGAIRNGDSGDDIFLLQDFMQKNRTIKYAYSRNLFAKTHGAKRLTDFMHQRLRWAGKNKNVSIPKYKSVMIYLGILQFMPLIICVFNLSIGLVFLVFKIVLDYYFIKTYRLHNEEKTSFSLFALSALLMPIYLSTLIVGPTLINPKWKGRKVNV